MARVAEAGACRSGERAPSYAGCAAGGYGACHTACIFSAVRVSPAAMPSPRGATLLPPAAVVNAPIQNFVARESKA